MLRKCKENYFKACFSRNAGNIKATWKIIRNICHGNQNNSIEKIVLDGTTYSSSADLAEIFNNYFVNIAQNLADNLPQSADSPYTYMARNYNEPIFLEPTCPDEVSNAISSLKLTKEDKKRGTAQCAKQKN